MRSRANMTRYVERMVEEGQLDTDPATLGHIFWAGLHGLISLQMSGQLGAESPSVDVLRREMMRRNVQSAARGRGRRPPTDAGETS